MNLKRMFRPPRTTPLSDEFMRLARARVKTVLFADDDPAIGEMILRVESMLAMDVTVVRSAAEAKRLITERDFDAVILDYRLLNGSSVPVYEDLVSRSPKTYVVFITGGSLDQVSNEVHKIGPAPIYPKPEALNLGFFVNLLGQIGIRPRTNAPF